MLLIIITYTVRRQLGFLLGERSRTRFFKTGLRLIQAWQKITNGCMQAKIAYCNPMQIYICHVNQSRGLLTVVILFIVFTSVHINRWQLLTKGLIED